MIENDKDNKAICLAPWVHLYINPSGVINPCCYSADNPGVLNDFSEYLSISKDSEIYKFSELSDNICDFGLVQNNTLRDIWNNNKFKQLRLNMIKGIKSDVCSLCYLAEEKNYNSLRLGFNEVYKDQFYRIDETNDDDSVDKFEPISFDLRLSNKCNFKCIMCNEEYSSSWEEEIKKYKNIDLSSNKVDADSILSQLDSCFATCKEIQFAGGEPLLMESHYKILKKIIEFKNINCNITYITNFSILNYKNTSILDIWKKLPNLSIRISIDGIGERGELIRKGFRWNNFMKNIQQLKSEIPTVPISYQFALQALNCFHVTEVQKKLFELGLLDSIDEFSILHVTTPKELSFKILPKSLKIKAKSNIKDHIKNFVIPNLSENSFRRFDHLGEWLSIISYLSEEIYSSEYEKLKSKFINYIDYLDLVRNHNTRETFPELSELWK
jgi:MoaA/NifB/PqqE/SkfB family radical SAM enzyme